MCIIPQEVTENSVNILRIENYTKKDVSYGNAFNMEYFHEDQWTRVEWDLLFEEIAYSLYAGHANERVIHLYTFVEWYNDSRAGKYRIIKKVGKYDLIAEFEVK